MGSAVAYLEGTPAVPNTPADHGQLVRDITDLCNRLQVVGRLQSYGDALQSLENPGKDAHYFLLRLEPAAEGEESSKLVVKGYRLGELQQATADYMDIEQAITDAGSGGDAVLVSVDSLSALRRAYPNYYLDTRLFLDIVQEAVDLPTAVS